MVPEPGTQLGIYRLTQRLGAGGMGEVWKAEDTRLHRNVAIKLLAATMTGDEESRARLLREARTAGQLYHPNIATIHGIELEGETPYIVMEYVEGESLARAIASRRLTEPEIAELGRGIADALAEAHAKGIIHRDIKPDNVVLSGNRVKVLDFGIAKRYGDAAQTPPGEIVTEAGVVLGTATYMSPEQATGRPLDGRSDIFALGIMLYQALAGHLPFRGKTGLEILKKILREDAPDLRSTAPQVSAEMALIVGRCLRKPLEERYQSATELARDLARVAARGLIETPPRPMAPPEPSSGVDAITMIQALETPPRPATATVATPPTAPRPTMPGVTRPAMRAVDREPLPAEVPAAPSPVTAPNIAQASTEAEPATAAFPMHWLIAGASFVVVLAVAGGFLVATILGNRETQSLAGTPAGIAATAQPAAPGTSSTIHSVAAHPATQSAATAAPSEVSRLVTKAPPPVVQPPRRAPITEAIAATHSVAPAEPLQPETPPVSTGPKTSYRAAMDALEEAGFRHLDDQGRMAANIPVAEALFQQALDAEPDHSSAQLHLAVIKLFRRRFDLAQKALYPLLTNDRLSFEERAIASFAYSASAIAAAGTGSKEFEASLDQALDHYGNSPQFVAFAKDARWIVNRGARR